MKSNDTSISTIQELVNFNARVLTLMGIMTSIMIDVSDKLPRSEKFKFDWIMDAINAVVYENKPIPPIPERVFL